MKIELEPEVATEMRELSGLLVNKILHDSANGKASPAFVSAMEVLAGRLERVTGVLTSRH